MTAVTVYVSLVGSIAVILVLCGFLVSSILLFNKYLLLLSFFLSLFLTCIFKIMSITGSSFLICRMCFIRSFSFLHQYYRIRNDQNHFISLHHTAAVNTISRSFDAENLHRFNQQQSLSRTFNQVHSDPPPSYDEIVLDIRLANPNTAIVY